MGLLKKIFGGGAASTRSRSSQFHESGTSSESSTSPNAPRRELVKVVLRDTMRKHAIPSNWIDCRTFSVITRQHTPGMHVQFIVRDGEERLLDYVHAFQDSFWEEIEKFEPQARQWLFSLSWQFEGVPVHGIASMPTEWGNDGDTQPPEEDTRPGYDEHPDELASDLQALYAIRDAVLSQPAELTELPAPDGQPSSRAKAGSS
jgi:hypothetical protein